MCVLSNFNWAFAVITATSLFFLSFSCNIAGCAIGDDFFVGREL